MAIRKKKDDNQFEKMTFEEAIESLTDVVGRIENGQIPLAESLQQYEKGMAIIRHCRRILLDAEKRIEQIADDKQACPPAGDQSETEEQEQEQENNSKEEPGDDESLF
ncbi:MAG: exodeoxyribonuclease VII small subunit [Planctomycetaceae bacterium]|nr:exodeoxyribonuclease VII small subunit [Planctomycetaceae bacterium]